MTTLRQTPSRWTIAIALWVVGVCAGFSGLVTYQSRPGVAAVAPAHWPNDSRIEPNHTDPTLIILAHPHCPCTRASIGELAQLMAHVQGRVSAYVLFLQPGNLTEDWHRTDLWRSAESIPGVTVLDDPDGREAQHFNASTSGQALLYDRDGGLVFSGGITAARGHSGDNLGRSALLSFLTTGATEDQETPVFGCSLVDNTSVLGTGTMTERQ